MQDKRKTLQGTTIGSPQLSLEPEIQAPVLGTCNFTDPH